MGVELMTLVRSIGGAIGNPGQVPAGLVLTGVQLDSRRVQPGDLFVALAGSQRDGWSFVPQAIERGAAAILASDLPAGMALPIPVWLHPDPRRALGLAAATFAGNPSRDLEVVAITGTNGKTTTAFLLRSLLRAQGQDPALLGTTGYYLARGVFEPAAHHARRDHPAASICAPTRSGWGHGDHGSQLARPRPRTARRHLGRLGGVHQPQPRPPRLPRGHGVLRGEQGALFACLDRHGAAVLNADDHEYPRMVHAARAAGRGCSAPRCKAPRTCGPTTCAPTPRARVSTCTALVSRPPESTCRCSARTTSRTCCRPSPARAGSVTTPPVCSRPCRTSSRARCASRPIPLGPGRPAAWVDYAHTPDALQNVLTSLRRIEGGGKLWVLFGCGGERDQGKRAQMGEVAARLADEVWITSDNPRSEEPAAIANAIWQGLCGARDEPRGLPHRTRSPRSHPFHPAGCRAGDRVLIAGKGHESDAGNQRPKLPFDDRAVAQEVLV
ncbi:MAG: cyanophycin synthetase [Planctomycetota bacterium]